MEKRVYVRDVKKGSVLLKGWVHELRDLANVKFILLRDISGIIQCVVKEKKLFREFSKLTLETVIEIKGRVNKAKVKSSDVTEKDIEVEVTGFEILSSSEKLPITVTEKGVSIALPKRLDHRSIDMRKSRVKSIFAIQSEIVNAFREFFYKAGFMEIQTPCIIASASEGGTELFPVQYFEKKAYLAQSPQLYKQLAAISLERVFCTVPVWRAEKHNTSQHLNESRQLDIEVAFENDLEVLKWLEEVMKFIAERVKKNCDRELKTLGVDLKVPKVKYFSYDEAAKKLEKHKLAKKGDDFSPEAERKLCELYPNTVLLIHSYPLSLKPFYIWPKDEKKNLSGGFDALYGGIEISSGGQRIHVPEILIRRLNACGLNPKDFKHYIDAFRFGAPYHSGWSIGLERLTMAMLGLENIREVCLFPRDRDRLTP